MSASKLFLVRTFRVGRYTCTLSVANPGAGTPAAASVEWTPHLPIRLSNAEVAQYRKGRDKAASEIAALLGGSALVIES